MSLLKDKNILTKKKVTLKIVEKDRPVKVTLKLDRDMVIDEDAFAKALRIKVPNVVGMSISDAVAFLKSKGIKYKLIGKEVVPREGSVYATSPRAGETIGIEEELQVMVNDSVSK